MNKEFNILTKAYINNCGMVCYGRHELESIEGYIYLDEIAKYDTHTRSYSVEEVMFNDLSHGDVYMISMHNGITPVDYFNVFTGEVSLYLTGDDEHPLAIDRNNYGVVYRVITK